MVNLLTLITSKLENVNANVYNEEIPEKTLTEYIDFRLPNDNVLENSRDDIILEVDVWSRNTNNAPVEALADAVVSEFKNYRYYESGQLQACFYLINRLQVPSGEKGLRRRQLRFLVKTYFLS